VREYKQAQSGAEIKTASVKVAEQDEADSSGQLDVEPLHQEGESTTMPKNGPSAKKEAVASEADEADSSGQLDVEPLHQEGESTTLPKNGPSAKKDAGSEEEVKEDEIKEEDEVKEAGIKGNCGDCGKPNFLCKCKGKGNGPGEGKGDGKGSGDGECGCKEEEEKEASVEEDKEEEDKEEKEANTETRFVKMANLDEKNETFLRDYWNQQFPSDYVDAMLEKK